MSKLYLGKPLKKDKAIEVLKDLSKETFIFIQNDKKETAESKYTNIDYKKALTMAIERLKEQKIDIEFEIKHYQAMINNPTPDVTEYDIHKAYIIIDFLRQFRAINYEKGRTELNKIKEYK